MKITLLISFMLAVLINFLVAFPVHALAPGLNLSLVSQQPFPAEPGQNVELELEIRNTGLGEARNITLSWIASAPFTLLPGQGPAIIGLLPGQTSITKIFRFRVDSSTFSGNYPVEWRLDLGSGTTLTEKTTVSVRGAPHIVLQKVAVEPAAVGAGGTAQLMFFLHNAGTGTARRLTVSLNGTPDVIPLLSSSAFLGDVLPGAFTIATLQVAVETAAEQKINSLQLTVEAEGESGTRIASVFPVGFPVSGTVLLDLLKVSADMDSLDVELANKGSADAKAVEARLLSGSETVDSDYVSQIKPDKKVTFSFPLTDKGNLSLQLRYRGPGLEQQERTLPLTVAVPRQAGNSFPAEVLVVIIIIAGGVWYWRRRRKKTGV